MNNPESNLGFDDIFVGDKVKIISKCVDFTFFYGETGVVTENKHRYLGITVKFDSPRNFQDGSTETHFNFNPKNLEIIEKRSRIVNYPEVLGSDYEQTIDELVKAGNNMAIALKEINEKYTVVWEDGGESCPAYIQWINLLNKLER